MNRILTELPPELTLPGSGKIRLPSKITRVRLDIGLSETAPMSRQWIQEDKDNDLLVFGFEPNPKSREILKHGSSQWPDPIDPKLIGKKLIVLPFALYSQEGVNLVPFFTTKNNSGCSSLFHPKTIEIEEKIQVEAIPLKSFFSIFPFDQVPFIEYIKIDAQGADFEIIKGIGHYLARVAIITLEPEQEEYPDAINPLEEIDQFLNQNHFFRCYSLDCDDPTFVNKTYRDLVTGGKIKPYQKG